MTGYSFSPTLKKRKTQTCVQSSTIKSSKLCYPNAKKRVLSENFEKLFSRYGNVEWITGSLICYIQLFGSSCTQRLCTFLEIPFSENITDHCSGLLVENSEIYFCLLLFDFFVFICMYC